MNSSAAATIAAISFVWLGMVLAISFVETPLKFRAPGVTIPIGLGIGRLVFRALNLMEAALALVMIIALLVGGPPASVGVAAGCAVLILVVQLAAIRPRLGRRANRVVAGEDLPRSAAHLWYVATELAKVAALITLGVLTLTA